MRTVVLYWNHICVLHRFEKEYLERVRVSLAEVGIDLQITYFGLGYQHHLASYLNFDTCVLPDLIVSSDLEVFENARLSGKLAERYPCSAWIPLKSTPAVNAVRRRDDLLPFMIIPLVLYSSRPCTGEPLPELAQSQRLSFGGIDNSAGKTVAKAVWERYGKQRAEQFMDQCLITDMPVQAFQNVRTGAAHSAIIPSFYALRADSRNGYHGVAGEGPLLLPSYFCARTTVSEQDARLVCAALMAEELLDFYVEGGDLIACPAHASQSSTHELAPQVLAVSQSFIDEIDDAEFYAAYRHALPQARSLAVPQATL